MVKPKQKIQYLTDGNLDTPAWVEKIRTQYHLEDTTLLNKTCLLAMQLTQGLTTFYGQSYLEQGLEIAEIILDLQLDQKTAAAAILSSASTLTSLSAELISKELHPEVANLFENIQQIEMIPSLPQYPIKNRLQTDNLRKMLLTMAKDIRVVIIKLAQRVCLLRAIKNIPTEKQTHLAKESLEIYAPLANRLGIGQLKWELEDLAFYYLDPLSYKTIAKFLAERRIDREQHIQQLIDQLYEKFAAAKLLVSITGRAKHIYSIYLKAQRKQLKYSDIYDYSAIRILVDTVHDCYNALSIVHGLWQPIIDEFDDYIAHPKANGYRSIHTAVIDENGKQFEIQIRTHHMHEEAERGVAAHWLYKENEKYDVDDNAKITYLRQLLDWHQEILTQDAAPITATTAFKEIYVITPAGDILALPKNATPLDFAYHIHSELGHRCRGAKVNGHIVPLTHELRTGDRIEVMTIAEGAPSRDWLNAEIKYVTTTRARNKIAHWFKQQILQQDILAGKQQLDRELARHGLTKIMPLQTLARHFNFKTEDALFVALNRGSIRLGQIIQVIQPKNEEKNPPTTISSIIKPNNHPTNIVADKNDLLTRLAKCCKPLPDDQIIGYITLGRGISIHKKSCANVVNFSHPERFIAVDWNLKNLRSFSTDLKIIANEQEKVLSDLTALFHDEKVDLLKFHSNVNKNHNKIIIHLTMQIQHLGQLQNLLSRIQQLPHVITANRIQ